ncbi:MAG: diaminopimelate epimerase [Desulfovibrio sp.]|nr:diaminopimelate epimerase [Desulfovibrio sp.]
MQKIPFTKMQGLGNDYVYINCFTETIDDPESLARTISDRHFGVGSDGLVLLLPSEIADLRMRMFNADGSEAQMCGNASRCVGKLAYEQGLVKRSEIRLETKAGIKTISLHCHGDTVTGATVDMGRPILTPKDIPLDTQWAMDKNCVSLPLTIADTEYRLTCVSMGNPHAVLFVDDVDAIDVKTLGPLFENHHVFPERTNTEFISILNRNEISMRVWERGAGETLACGTGACASVVASVLNERTERSVLVHLLGGDLFIEWKKDDNHVFMTGPCTTVFEGVFLFDSLPKESEGSEKESVGV